ncbi:uncharacterized protein LOC116257430 [Nymphaea colorata]|nr:uncharacterized protein LOC116257430 [Nymphaea colorata]XP_049934617.1 uncharacterized protein LOC116257430 [Nymphaea colorata]
MLEDIDSLEDVKNIMCKARQAVKFLYNKQHALDIMRTYTKGKELRRPGVTRFASQFICLDSILKQEEGLKFMVASNDWRHVENTEKNDAKELTRLIQNEDFWRKAKEIIRFVEPLVRVLKMVDGEGATMGYLYEALDRAKEAIKSACNNMREKYMPYWSIIDKRWNRNLNSPIYAAAAYLNPHLFWNNKVRMNDEVRKGLELAIEKLLVPEDCANMSLELAKYQTRHPSLFRGELSMNIIDTSHPRVWWLICGCSVPILQRVAIKILSQPCSASACERNWSAFEAVNTKKRSNLLPSRLTDLVFIRMNMHLQSMAAEIANINADRIYIDHVNPFPEAENLEVGLSSDLEEEDDEECGPSRTNEEDDSTSWDED